MQKHIKSISKNLDKMAKSLSQGQAKDPKLCFDGSLGSDAYASEASSRKTFLEQLRYLVQVKTIVGEMAADQRQEAVDAFQNDPAVSVLILSLQAGGVGLNLTAATHAKEAQATDRAHRIGQTRTVFVHRLITKGTFEERLHDIMVATPGQKDDSDSDMVPPLQLQTGAGVGQGGEGWIADLNNDELRERHFRDLRRNRNALDLAAVCKELFELSGERTDGPAVKRRKRAEAQDHDGRAGRAGMNAMDVDGVFHQVPRLRACWQGKRSKTAGCAQAVSFEEERQQLQAKLEDVQREVQQIERDYTQKLVGGPSITSA
eukprot:s4178_g3.t1